MTAYDKEQNREAVETYVVSYLNLIIKFKERILYRYNVMLMIRI
jgi:hypothetical protein